VAVSPEAGEVAGTLASFWATNDRLVGERRYGSENVHSDGVEESGGGGGRGQSGVGGTARSQASHNDRGAEESVNETRIAVAEWLGAMWRFGNPFDHGA